MTPAVQLHRRDAEGTEKTQENPPRSLRLHSEQPGPDFQLPPELEAHEPPEARSLARDDVRLLVSYRADNQVIHAHFRDLPSFLVEGDIVVVNTSGTLPAALPVTRADGSSLELHLSTRLPAGLWLVELRRPDGSTTRPFADGRAGERLRLPGGATATIHAPYSGGKARSSRFSGQEATEVATTNKGSRLWVATLDLPTPLVEYLNAYGRPIHYYYVSEIWPLSYYQTVYATEMGSAEMPSAGRAFTPEMITQLIAQGVQVAPLILHTGVASLEEHDPPYEEYYRVPPTTARMINAARAGGGRVIAVGTTVVRALETVVDAAGVVHPAEGWTELIITPQRGLRVVDGLLTGLHEPEASHLMMLEVLAGRGHLRLVYEEALRQRYLWHEFGDLHLILP